MDKFIITGPTKLSGKVRISGSKNASLPIFAATILNDKTVTLGNVPDLRDINTTVKLLGNLGVEIEKLDKNSYQVKTPQLQSYQATYDLVKTMRASILVLGPMLARFGQAEVSMPGGCAIGTRPIDIHLNGLKKMGASIDIESGYVRARCQKLNGEKVVLPFPSVGATENLMMAAVYAKGETCIENAAREPEIVDLANFLKAQGVNIEGAGSTDIFIQGVSSLKSTHYNVMSDRIEAATFIIAGLITGSLIQIENVQAWCLQAVLDVLETMGAKFRIDESQNKIEIIKAFPLKGINVDTQPFPGFPTDVQAQILSLCCIVSGPSIITENIFENRFMHVPELQRMKARITLKGKSAMLQGDDQLSGAPVMCTDLRASAALVLAGLCAKGTTEVGRVYHIDRGYERIDLKLKELGAQILRVAE